MRLGVLTGVLIVSAATEGCQWLKWFNRQDAPSENVTRVFGTESPTETQVVNYLNQKAQLVSTLKFRTVDIDIKENGKSQPGVRAILICQKPKDFRLQGKAAVGSVVDIGSNDKELWFWIKYMEPEGVYHCSYDDLAAGRVKNMPLPIKPEWIVQVMGIAEYNDDNSKYKLITHRDVLELQEQTVSLQGQPMTRVTLFNRQAPSAGKPLIMQHRLVDANGSVVCWAEITEVQADRADPRIVLPTQVRMVWPAQKLEIKMKIDDDFKVNDPIKPEDRDDLFSRRNLADLPSFDLARGPDGPGVKRAGGVDR